MILTHALPRLIPPSCGRPSSCTGNEITITTAPESTSKPASHTGHPVQNGVKSSPDRVSTPCRVQNPTTFPHPISGICSNATYTPSR